MSEKKANYLLVSEHYVLNIACVPIWKRYQNVYLVGSVLLHKDWRDVDIRCMVTPNIWHSVKGGFMDAAISEWLRSRTGLPIDFQFQDFESANKEFNGDRSALGILS